MESHIESESNMQDVIELQKFITRTWNHPLLDSRTIEHREEAKTKLANILVESGVMLNDFFTVPIGSLLWATDDQSDFDYHLVTIGKKSSYIFNFNQEEYHQFYDRCDLENVWFSMNHLMDVSEYGHSPYTVTNLLFTPDEYIVGNLAAAQNVRLLYANRLKPNVGFDLWVNNIWGIVENYWERFFRNWDDLSLENSQSGPVIRHPKENPERERRARIDRNLARRSQQSSSPQRYIEAFTNARQRMNIIDSRIYSNAIIATNGALSINNRFNAIGIEDL